MTFYLGIDLGQINDNSVVLVAERHDMPVSSSYEKRPGMYHIVYLHRFPLKTPYTAIVEAVQELLSRDPLKGNYKLVLDTTGVGLPIADMFRQAGMKPACIVITGGTITNREGSTWRVPKRDLISTLQVLLQSGRLKIAKDLPEAATLMNELLSFRMRITLDGNDQYGAWRENDQDDEVLAAAIACWYGEKVGGQLRPELPATAPRERRWTTITPELDYERGWRMAYDL